MSEEREVKRISVKEFRALGFLQDSNRLLLHPCGLALEVVLDKETDEGTFGGVWDYREDPACILFAEDIFSVEKAVSVSKLMASKAAYCKENFGYTV